MNEYTAPAPHQVSMWADLPAGVSRMSTCRLSVAARIDTPRLLAALRQVWRRHEALRCALVVPALRKQPVLEICTSDGPSIRMLSAADDMQATQAAQPSIDIFVQTREVATTSVALRYDAAMVDPESWLLIKNELAAALAETPMNDTVGFADVAGWLETQVAVTTTLAARGNAWRPVGDALVWRDGPVAANCDATHALTAWYATLSRFRAEGSPDVDVASSVRHLVGEAVGVGALRVPQRVGVQLERDMPFSVLLDAVARDPALSRPSRLVLPNSAADAGFAWFDIADEAAGAVAIEQIEWAPGGAPVTLACSRIGPALYAHLHHDPRVVNAATAEALRAAFACALTDGLNNGATCVDDLAMSETAGHVAAGAVTDSSMMSFLSRFEAVAENSPDAVALESWSPRSVQTYRELNDRAASIAAGLAARGVRAGDVVALILPRGPAFVAALIGAHKCGAIFMPVSRSAPTQRVEALLSGAQAVLAIASAADIGRLGVRACPCVDPLELQSSGTACSRVDPVADDIAYILHTSGSSGLPKPVELTHGGLANYLAYAVRQYRLADGGGAIVQSPVTFDLTLTSLLAPLCAGQRILLVPEAESGHGGGAEIDAVCNLLRRGGLTLLKTTPSYLRLLNAALSPQDFSGALRSIVVGGEALPFPVIAPWLLAQEPPHIFNEYGPTETVVGCACSQLTGPWPDGEPAPIGGPLDNTRLSVRDRNGRALPVGVTGEICVAGAGVGKGYRGRPEETQRRFVHVADEAGRLYRTGDRGRMREDGTLDYLGRLDDQIKLNGIRLEPGEIERCLEAAPGVKSAAVVKVVSSDAADSLTAFVTIGEDAVLQPESLKELARSMLPSALVPAQIVMVAALPLSANGKIDRAALTAQAEALARAPTRTFVAPQGPMEQALAAIFGAVLGRDAVSVADDFFDLGGDSIRSIAVVGQAAQRGIRCTVADLFNARTVRALAGHACFDAAASAAPVRAEPFALLHYGDRAALPVGLIDAYPISQLQAAMIFHGELEREHAVYHDVFSYRLQFAPEDALLQAAARQLVARHEALRTTFEFAAYSEPLQLVHAAGADILRIEDLRNVDADSKTARVGEAFDKACAERFDVGRLPLLKVFVQRLDEATVQFTMSFHHAIIDGWSDVSLLMELFELYRALLRGEAIRSAPATRYVDYLRLEQQALASNETRQFWRDYMHDAPNGLIGEGAAALGAGGPVTMRRVEIQVDVMARLRAFCQQASMPLKSVLLAVHLKVIAAWARQDECLTSIVMNGRPETADGQRAVGLFINSVPLRAKLGHGSWIDLVHRARDAENEILAFRRLPLAEIQNLCGGARLSDTLFYFTHYHVASGLKDMDVALLDLKGHEASSFSQVANFSVDPFTDQINLTIAIKQGVLTPQQHAQLASCYGAALTALAMDPEASHCDHQFRDTLDDTRQSTSASVVEAILRMAQERPATTAVIHDEQLLDYGELAALSGHVATRLRKSVRTGDRVALMAPRSPRFIAALCGILRAGAIYVPLDPTYPSARLSAILDDAQPTLVIVDDEIAPRGVDTLPLDVLLAPVMETAQDDLPAADSPAYLFYTSGSTGRPKGVLVSHGALAGMFDAMTATLGASCGTWLSMTSIGFDISLLEMLYPLTVGGRVVVHAGFAALLPPATPHAPGAPDFSLFFFASGSSGQEAYDLMLKAALRADQLGFRAIWTPERHFHHFGGPFPNPAVTSAALAVATERIELRAGSLVMPLHDPIRVAEDWAVVDVLSNGRAGIAIASGWDPDDFLLANGADAQFERRRETMIERLGIVRRLWRGESVTFERETTAQTVTTFPRPIQRELPVWLSAAGRPATFEAAGQVGAGVLTHLLTQDVATLRRHIARYRTSGGRRGTVSLMLHAFVAPTGEQARAVAQAPLQRYLMTSADFARSIPGVAGSDVGQADLSAVVAHGLERYIASASLIGSVDECVARARSLRESGVDEFACLIDFGVPADAVLRGLEYLDEVRRRLAASAPIAYEDRSFAALCEKHGVTHMQCTPTVLRELLGDERSRAAIHALDTLLVGGEVLPEHVAVDLLDANPHRAFNMYGPTETTIWSAAWQLESGPVKIGTALANSAIHLLDADGRVVPSGSVGEIVVSGTGLAEGYWRQPEMTTTAFGAVKPSQYDAPVRCYRTGDLGRRDALGRLEFVGRRDRQVKVGGHRIELAEIEAVIREFAGVEDAACVVDEAGALVAMATRRLDTDLSVTALRLHVQAKLEQAMWPVALTIAKMLPRTAHGKLDEAAVLAAARGEPAEEATEAPALIAESPVRTGTAMASSGESVESCRSVVAEVWRQTMLVPPVGATANFFAAGGNSLRAMVMASRLRQRLDSALSVRMIFDNPDFDALVLALSDRVQSASEETGTLAPPDRLGPVSFFQERLWLVDKILPGSAAYNDSMLVEVRGPLDRDSVVRALTALTARHDALRMSFEEVDGMVCGRFADAVPLDFEELDLTALPQAEREDAASAKLYEQARVPFDLGQVPLLRARLVRLDDSRHRLLVTVHHIVCDGWSLSVMLREFAILLASGPDALPRAAFRFQDHAVAERARLSSDRRAALLAYWRSQLAELPPPLELPLDYARPKIEAFSGTIVRRIVPLQLLDRLDTFARTESATTFVVVMVAVAAVLGRISGSNDVTLGTDVANRGVDVPLDAIGPFVSQILLRTKLAGEPSFRELVRAGRQKMLDALDHADLPFNELVNALAPDRDLGRNPLYQAAFTYQETAVFDSPDCNGLSLARVPLDIGISRVDIEINAMRGDQGLVFEVIYNDRLQRRESIERLLASIEDWLVSALAEPDRSIHRLDFGALGERRTLQAGLGSFCCAYDTTPVVERLRGWAARTPDALALVGPHERISYAQLHDRVEALAAGLAAAGVREGSLVATYLNRDTDLAIAMLSLWHLGAVYLPLDPAHPPPRLGQVLQRAKPDRLLTTAAQEAEAGALAGAPSLCVIERCVADPLSAPEVASLSSLPAYVLFTSGSTGVPKGAIVRHDGMVNHLGAKIADLQLCAGDRLAQTAPLTFDISIWQIIAPLMVGGTVHIFADDIVRDPSALIQACDDAGITVLETVPSFLELIVGAANARDTRPFDALRVLMSTGEALPVRLCRKWFEAFPDRMLVNAYGPTECSDDVTHHVMTQPPPEDAPSIPIGRPIGNVRLYVLNDGGQLCLRGEVGELYVAGIPVGAGYLNDTDTTARYFVPDPFVPSATRPMYRTGDLARWRSDGELEYFGRVDSQVKIRGCRIELGEIETVLNGDPLVQRSVVTVLGDADSGQRLAAYVAPDWARVETTLGADILRLSQQEWRSVYDYYYQENAAQQNGPADPTFDLAGWTDSFAGLPIPEDHMRDWRDQAVRRIEALAPRRVLEIGCGTGMILFGLGQACERYVGIDFSEPVVARLREVVREHRPTWRHVRLEHRAADELDGLDEQGFDVIVLNSIVQYFPSPSYLLEVLRHAATKLAPGGCIYLGDLRSLELQHVFHAALLDAHADSMDLTSSSFEVRASLSAEHDKELVLAESFFAALLDDAVLGPRRPTPLTWLKSGAFDNELTRYRIDVALSFDDAKPALAYWERPWSEFADDLSRLEAALAARPPHALLVSGLPNARMENARLRAAQRTGDVASPHPAPTLDALLALAALYGYQLQSRFSEDTFAIDVLFHVEPGSWPARRRTATESNNPLHNRARQPILERLQELIRERLPDYMAPHSITVLEQLPLTTHGKIDRKALPRPILVVPDDKRTDHLPRTAAELTLARVWREVLGAMFVGLRDNFFSVGGDSILAIQIVSAAARAGLRLTPKQVFQHQTLAEMAAAAQATEQLNSEPAASGSCPLSPNQATFFARSPAVPQHWNQAMIVKGALLSDAAGVRAALDRVAARHDALRLRFRQDSAGIWQQHYAKTGPTVHFEVLGPNETLADAALRLNSGMSLEHGPLLHTALEGGAEPKLLVIAHHLVIDGVSWRILIEDLTDALEAGGIWHPPARTASYRAWVERAISLAESHELEEDRAYWMAQRRLGPAHPISGSPGRRIADVGLFGGALEAGLSARVLAIGSGARIEVVLLTALTLALRDVSGWHDVVVGNEGHGRDLFDDLDVSRTLGWFATAYPVRLRLPSVGGADAELTAIARQAGAARARAASFGILCAYDPDVELRRELISGAVSEITFTYFGRLTNALAADGLSRVEADVGPLSAPENAPETALEVTALSAGDVLSVFWSVDRARLDPAVVTRVADAFAAALGPVLDASDRLEWTGLLDYVQDTITDYDLDAALAEVSQ